MISFQNKKHKNWIGAKEICISHIKCFSDGQHALGVEQDIQTGIKLASSEGETTSNCCHRAELIRHGNELQTSLPYYVSSDVAFEITIFVLNIDMSLKS